MVLRFGLELSCEVVDLLKREGRKEGQGTGKGCQYLASLLLPLYSNSLFSHCIHSSNFSFPTHLLFSQLQQLFLGLLHLTSGPSDGDLVGAGALGGEMDVDAAAVIHDGAHEATLGADQRVVQLGGNGDLCLFNVGLEGRRETGRY